MPGENTASPAMAAFTNDCTRAVNDFYSTYDSVVDNDNDKARDFAAQHGGGFKPSDRPRSDDGKKAVGDAAQDLSFKINSSLEKYGGQLYDRLAEPPSDKALNALNVLRSMKDVSPIDIQSLAHRYGGDNYLFDCLLYNFAAEHKVHVEGLNPSGHKKDIQLMQDLGENLIRSARNVARGSTALSPKASKAVSLDNIKKALEGRGLGISE